MIDWRRGCLGRTWLAVLAASLGTLNAPAAVASQGPQDGLRILVNDGFADPAALRYDWPLISIGTGQYEAGPTGLTVVRFGRKVLGAVDVRGGGPGTVNAAYLQLGNSTPEVDAVVFSGGSWYGLEAVTAVNSALKDDGVRSGSWDNIGLAVGSIIYDFGARRLNEIYPDKRLAQAALRAARGGVIPLGAYGAGRSAVSGSLLGCNARSGQGAAYRQVGKLKILVFTVVNALGVVTDRQGRVVACNPASSWPQPLTATYLMNNAPDSLRPEWSGEPRNTTISLVVVNQRLEPAQLQRLAVQVHTSMARSIQPFATEFDGDVLYAVSTGELEGGDKEAATLVEMSTVASELMWDAVLASVPRPAVTAAPNSAGFAAMQRTELVGAYQFSPTASLQISRRGTMLFARATGKRPVFGIAPGEEKALQHLGGAEFQVAGRHPLTLRFAPGQLVLNPGRWQQVGTRQPAQRSTH